MYDVRLERVRKAMAIVVPIVITKCNVKEMVTCTGSI